MDVHELVTDELWASIEPLLPPHPPHPPGGNDFKPDRPALCGIIYVLQEGIDWNTLPLALGCDSGMTCWRRFQEWRAAGSGGSCTACYWSSWPGPRRSTGRG
jgi:transposase